MLNLRHIWGFIFLIYNHTLTVLRLVSSPYTGFAMVTQKFLTALVLASTMCTTVSADSGQAQVTPESKNSYQRIAECHLVSLSAKNMAEEKIKQDHLKKIQDTTNFFNLLSIELPPVGSVEKTTAAFTLLANTIKPANGQEPAFIDKTVISDLKLFAGASDAPEQTLFSKLNHTQTTFGLIELEKMLCEPTTNIEQLNNRQAVIKALYNNQEMLKAITESLTAIAKAEDNLMSFWLSKGEFLRTISKGVYWPELPVLDALNQTPATLQLGLSYKPLSLAANVFGAYWFNSSDQNIMKLCAQYICISQLILSPLTIYMMAFDQKNTRTIHTVMNDVATIVMQSQKIASLIERDKTISSALNLSSTLNNASPTASKKLTELVELLKTNTFTGNATIASYQGRALYAFKLMLEVKSEFDSFLKAVGQIDAHASIAKLYASLQSITNARYCFPTYQQATAPHITLDGFWMPGIKPANAVLNTIEIGGNCVQRGLMVTGPNAGGKSTALKGITTAILLAQTICIAPANSMTLTPFKHIKTYMNIADTTGSASLYQAEMRRTHDLINTLKTLKDDEFAFAVMDEIFTGANAKEGEAGAFGVAKKLSSMPNALCIFATHFQKLTELENLTHGALTNYKVAVVKNDDGSFSFPYKLEPGITDQSIALALLAQEGFDEDILADAQSIINQQR
jgi:DNA mismatch repair ATPase MutS